MSDQRPVRFDDQHRLEVPPEILDGEVAREDAQRAAVRPDPTKPRDDLAAPFAAPIRKSSGLRRPIDDYDWTAGRAAPVSIEVVPGAVSFEIEPCPRWMRTTTYARLMVELRAAVERDGDAFVPTKIQRWTLRHVWRVEQPPSLETSGGAYDLIGPALALLRMAKKRSRLDEVGLPTRRRLG